MKKSLFTIAFACVAMAGYSQQKSHKVNVTIPEVIDMQMSEDDMDFEYTETNINDNTDPETQSREVRVRSNVAWNVTVYAESDFENADASASLDLGILTLSVPDGEGGSSDLTPSKREQVTALNEETGLLEPVVDLVSGEPVYNNNAQTILSGEKGGYGVNTNDVTYAISLANDSSIDEDYFLADPDTYSTTLVYTVSAE
ncbi:hypothetical protein [Jiulongibacter sp. NS-SX5]|uniref:hypothetical protein n=1 Tax=Jiulongibacter sp. NS-SX5 TaxID=3463854 RepID=UPI004059E29C